MRLQIDWPAASEPGVAIVGDLCANVHRPLAA